MIRTKRQIIMPVLAAAVVATGSFFGLARFNHSALAETSKPTPTPQLEVVAPASDLSRAFRAVHESMKDAVVNINVAKHTHGGNAEFNVPEQFRGMLPPGLEDQLRGQMQDQVQEGT